MKTKEQILQQAFVGQEADIHLNIRSGYKFGHYPDSVQRTYIYASMQFFADQEKQALKDRIKKALNNFSNDKHGRIFTTEVIDLIERL